MKTILIALLLIATTSVIVNAQQNRIKKSKIPDQLTEAFSKKYSNINVKEWYYKDKTYIAKFKSDEKKYEASFTADGEWIQTITRIKWEEIPISVRKAFYETEFVWLNKTSLKMIEGEGVDKLYLIEGDNMNIESVPNCKFKLFYTPGGKLDKLESDC